MRELRPHIASDPAAHLHPRPALFAQMPDSGHVVIEASAGTGKTWTIERLVVDLILRSGCSIDQILVVTFTVRATHELKIRIRRTLESLLEPPQPEPAAAADETPERDPLPDLEDSATGREDDHDDVAFWRIDDDARARLTRALAHFDTASILTIHAFCQKVLRDHAFACGRPLEQTVVDARMAFGRAFRVALRAELARSPQLRSLLGHWLTHRSVRQLENVLFRYHRQQGRFRPRIDGARLLRMSELAWEVSDLVQQPGAARRIAESYEEAELNETDLAGIREMMPGVIRALSNYEPERWGDLVSALNDVDLRLLYDPRPAFSTSFASAGFTAGLAPEVRAFAEGIRALHPVLIPLDAAAVQWFLPTVNELLGAMKAREGWLDHDDMLLGVRDALRSRRGAELARLLRGRYRFALIDEFQDTDLVQWEIFQRLFIEAQRAEGGSGTHRLFVIGDPKQAIYSFRGGDVVTYLHAREALRGHTGHAPLRLRDNYRSTARMIAAHNLLFDQRAPAPFFTGAICYDEPVRCARPALRLVDVNGEEVAPLALIAVTDPKEPLRSATARKIVGRRIAAEIRRLLHDQPLFLVDTPPSGGAAAGGAGGAAAGGAGAPRPLLARDIFVLTRTNYEANELAGYLREQGVPHAFFKRDGLFQTAEARDVRDLLTAVAHPNRRSARLKAWYTPFFGVELGELRDCTTLPDTHPLIARLYAWHALARAQRYERLFSRIIAESGVLRREIFYAPSERQLTNILHIFEIMLDEVARSRGTLDDLVGRLSAFIDGREQPPGIDGNVQRLESERAAVQLMTIHKAKGLEAPIVFLYGGFTGGSGRAPYIYHLPADDEDLEELGIEPPPAHAWSLGSDEEVGAQPEETRARSTPDALESPYAHMVRVIGLEMPQSPEQRTALERELREEDQRLLYVAATRAMARLYLPFYRHDDLNGRALRYFADSAYEVLRKRLEAILEAQTPAPAVTLLEPAPTPGAPPLATEAAPVPLASLLDTITVRDDSWLPRHRLKVEAPLREWHPPAELLALPSLTSPPDGLRNRRFVITSYSRMKAAHGSGRGTEREAPAQPEVSLPEGALPGGAATGAFLHDLLERVPFASIARVEGSQSALEDWAELPEVAPVFEEAHFRHGIAEFFRPGAEALVYTALRAPVQLRDGRVLDGLAACEQHLPEVEFVYPLPESFHPRFDQIDTARRHKLTVERGWVKGYIDLVFEVDGRVYFLDWKSDLMADYGPIRTARHIDEHYAWQARLYTLAVCRMLQAHDAQRYEQRFGGLLYCFLRGMQLDAAPGHAVVFTRPSWAELLEWERQLTRHRRFG